jgi:hypothetical protein
MKRKVLHLPKSEGGFKLPDLELYQLTIQGFYLRHIVKCTKEEQWEHIEDAHPLSSSEGKSLTLQHIMTF